MRVQLRQELLFVTGRHRTVTPCRFRNDVQGMVAVTGHVPLDGGDVDGKVAGRLLH